MELSICHLYPDLMNIYGDRGNVLALLQRCAWHGVDVVVESVSVGQDVDFCRYDLIFFGGGQDKEQAIVCRDLQGPKGPSLLRAAEEEVVILSICGGYQLLGRYYRTGKDQVLPGIGLFDAWTEAGTRRMIGNVIIETELCGHKHAVVGFENHSGRTYLGEGTRPLGRVLVGHGNNSEDGFEGAVFRNAYGTYLHGCLLPKNPALTDHLIALALRRRYGGEIVLGPLDDTIEKLAHEAAKKRALELAGHRV